ncbi:nicotinate-nucleotide--dimethylbenzimidazole phosphoribosyltransferase [Cellulosilyticum sp. I15G10I2]|uniref:nicotinate-nucleotide--dimethylbenzimidazole phosphoribosyltransferase n=1 Tax=Cellulosilyticum sp. I15G10I2 TaxID=1892843 RepID=UPI00085C7B04|nr:nicotinate-nucleotide--dimethylbenzimidazole phosphoribosyltransferase [Cellulosilyticum sp. I15G10I2]
MYNVLEYAKGIQLTDTVIQTETEKYIDNLTKPVGALGQLEEIVIKLAGIQCTQKININKKVVVIMCADNGVYDEGVSECPQDVTQQVTYNFTRGITGINRMTSFSKSDIYIVDIGVKGEINSPLVHNKKIRESTSNMCNEPAMTKDEAIKAINIGIEAVEALVGEGYEVFGTGEMGIGNTTTSAAVLSVLTGEEIKNVVGQGAGVKEDTFNRKVNAISRAIDKNNPEKEDIIDVLAKVGGFDLAGLCGVFIGAARNKKAVVIDGFISAVAALCACRIEPKCVHYMFPSHMSQETGMRIAMDALGLKPYFYVDMRLGEGTGCTLTFQLMDMALHTLYTMATFEEASIEKKNYIGIWK